MADKLLEKVKEYAAELEAAGRSPGYAYATAWARACKYHGELDEQAHCRRPGREYLTRTTNRRILGHLHRRCKNLPDAGYVMYWAARKAGVTTEGVVYKGHLVLLYGGEAFAPSLHAPEAIETAVAEGTPYTAAKPAAAIAAMADRVVGVERRSNPAPEHQLSSTQRRKYLGKLEGAQRQARAAEIVERRKPSNRSNAPFATDAGQVTRRSSHARSFEQVYGRAPADVADAARLTGIPEAVLDQVYARGLAAWQTGHRPGASQHAWALARVQSFATGGPTALGPDADLAAKVQNPAGRTETPEFKRWFGDSKVVDAEGKPLVVYHGTGAMFWEFRDWRPAFFTPDREYANLYTSKGKKPRIIQAYLKIERPFDPAKDADALRLFNQVFLPYWQRRYPTLYQSKEMHPLRIGEPLPFTMADEVWTFLRKLQREGSRNYDGMCVYEGSGITHAPAWVPLQPTQIKSATANKGTFDPQDPDIRNPAGQTFNPRQPAQVQNPTVQEFSAIAERVARDVPVSKAKQYGEDVRALIAELRSLRAAKLTPLELLDATNSARAKIKKLRQEGDTLLHKLADMRPPQTDTMYWWVQADINVLRQAVPFNADLRDIEDMALFLAEKITGRVLAYAQEAQREVVKRQLERERTVGKRRNPEYPMAGPKVSGLEVVTPVPDMDSISGSLDEYTILPGIREVPLSDFSLTGRSYSVKRSEWIELLANKIADNGWIAPLIVVVDRDGPYILEGSSRSEALFRLGVKTMPAVVVIDEGNPPAERNPTKSSRHSRR